MGNKGMAPFSINFGTAGSRGLGDDKGVNEYAL
jgi:hypothetical protein